MLLKVSEMPARNLQELEIFELHWNVEFCQWRTLRAREQLFRPSEALGPFSQAFRAGSSLAFLYAILKSSLIMVFIDYGLYSALGLTHLLHLWRMFNLLIPVLSLPFYLPWGLPQDFRREHVTHLPVIGWYLINPHSPSLCRPALFFWTQ